MRGSVIAHAHPHGLCARGNCTLQLEGSLIVNASTRALYAYHNVSVVARDTHFAGTQDATAAAVQVESLRDGDQASLLIQEGCYFEGNAGEDVLTKGNVLFRRDESK
mmetsp:Transcript_914/g.2490  ORF Transcript_914/g.2490 Transcript_914/m.2490 type:complete len:107 (+) Transcript_914:1809-2129(+)